MSKPITAFTAAALVFTAASPAAAQRREAVTLTTCEQSYGTIAIVDGDTQGWTAYGLGSPRELINALATESGCFTPHDPAGGVPADFLMNVIAGDSEEVDQSIELARTAAVEGLVRSGAATSVLSRVPVGGALFGALGGLGGKRKRVAAGIKLLNPATGQAVVAGSGEVTRTSITLGGGNPWTAGANAAGYGSSRDGRTLVEAFIKAFNAVSAQGSAISAARTAPATAAASASGVVAVDTVMRSAPAADAPSLRSLRAGAELTPTGNRAGLFVEMRDAYGTQGWVSVEDLR